MSHKHAHIALHHYGGLPNQLHQSTRELSFI